MINHDILALRCANPDLRLVCSAGSQRLPEDERMPVPAYPHGTRLRHHAGSVWQIVDHVPDGNYWIRCVTGTTRPDWIGGETEDTVREVHPDYLHGDGWTKEGKR